MQYDIKTDSFGDEELVMITTVENIRNLCQPYINEIKNTDLLTSKLKQFIDEVSIFKILRRMCRFYNKRLMFKSKYFNFGKYSVNFKYFKW